MGPMGKRLLRSASLLDYGGASLIPRVLSESEPAVRVNGTCVSVLLTEFLVETQAHPSVCVHAHALNTEPRLNERL